MKKLKFITLIESGERINVSSISTSQQSWFSSIYRSIFKESRAKTFQFLNDVIDRSFELIFLYKESKKLSDKISCYQILEDIMNSITGIRNIQQTYIEDRNFFCEMETLLASIFARLAEIYQNNELELTPVLRDKLSGLLENHPVRAVAQDSPVRAVGDNAPVRAVAQDSPVRKLAEDAPVREDDEKLP